MKKFTWLWILILALSGSNVIAAQHDYVINNASGAAFRADINNALSAIVTNNSAATEPATTYPNMWWYDTSTSLLKRRNNADTAWITVGLEAASTDGTFAANSDSLVPTQKAAKTYADTKISKSTASEIFNVAEKTTLADNDVFLIEDSAASYAKKKVKVSNLIPKEDETSAIQHFSSSGTFNVPAGVSTVLVTAVGGGGGGGGGLSGSGAGGGSGGAAINYPVTVTPSSSVTVTVGAAGAGNGASGYGTAGGTSSFGSFVVCTGGGGGAGGNEGPGGPGGTSTARSFKGTAGGVSPHESRSGGRGADSFFGISGNGGAYGGAAATAGSGFGSGGGGGGLSGSGGGANGAPGFVTVKW